MNSDVWADSDEEGEASTSARELESEWKNRRLQYWNSGYRDGIDEGKQRSLQEGFDEGYRSSTAIGHSWGAAKGAAVTAEKLSKQYPGLSVSGSEVMKVSDPKACESLCAHLTPGELPVEAANAERLLKAQRLVLSSLEQQGRPYSTPFTESS